MSTEHHYHEYEIGGKTYRYRQEWIGNIELRFEPEDEEDLDEVVLHQKDTKKCLIHMERMSDDCIWMALYADPYKLVIHFRPTEDIPCTVTWDIESEWTEEELAQVPGKSYAEVMQQRKDKLPRDKDEDLVYGPFTICEGWGGDDGVFDELFFYKDNICYLHMERLDECTMWMCVNDGKKGVHLHIGPSERHAIDVAEWSEDAWNEVKPEEPCLCGSEKTYGECCGADQ